jgi:XTP/dITP diphosphohydrolase
MKIVTATKNKGKVSEILNKFRALNISGIELLSLSEFPDMPDIIEDGSTFNENSLIKAKAVSSFTGFISIADDSGLSVDSLDGRPGVHSARYGDSIDDKSRNTLLLEEMKNIPLEKRNARFVCIITLFFPDNRSYSFKGECHGVINFSPSGKNGFGYDPVFFLPDYNKTMAELSIEEKNKISHRGKAIESLAEFLKVLR